MTDDNRRKQYRIAVEAIIELGREVGGLSEDYLREFAAVSAWHVLAVLEHDPSLPGDPWREFEAQALVVGETIQELGEQAARRAFVRAVIAATRLAASFAAAA